jgi:hypothetical protein
MENDKTVENEPRIASDDFFRTVALAPTLLGAVAGTISSDLEVLTKIGHIWDHCDTEGDFAYPGETS